MLLLITLQLSHWAIPQSNTNVESVAGTIIGSESNLQSQLIVSVSKKNFYITNVHWSTLHYAILNSTRNLLEINESIGLFLNI